MNMNTYSEMVFALADNVAATLRRKPDTDLKSLARDLYVQTFIILTDTGKVTGTPSSIVDEKGFLNDLEATLPVIH